MRKYFSIIYWSVVVLILSGILLSVTNDYFSSLLLSVTLLPGVIFAKYFWKDISFKNKWSGTLHTIYLGFITLLIEYLVLLLMDTYLLNYGLSKNVDIIFNPFFIWLLLITFLSVEKLLQIKLYSKAPEPDIRFINFISDRKKVSLDINAITYIESNDYEVWIRTTSGISYRTKMNISHWNDVLDSGFLRIHRSFLVNIKHITGFDTTKVWVEETPLEISRKYKEKVMEMLEK